MSFTHKARQKALSVSQVQLARSREGDGDSFMPQRPVSFTDRCQPEVAQIEKASTAVRVGIGNLVQREACAIVDGKKPQDYRHESAKSRNDVAKGSTTSRERRRDGTLKSDREIPRSPVSQTSISVLTAQALVQAKRRCFQS